MKEGISTEPDEPPGAVESCIEQKNKISPAARDSKTLEDSVSESEPPTTATVPYTVYTRSQKRKFRLLLGFATITSPLTATSYVPLFPILRAHFSASAQAINLTLTIYIVFQALSPAIFGPLSDSVGRRLVYIITLTLYTLGNLGLALNKSNYAALLVLRALQSLGASAALAISYGVVADICVPSERGRMLGPVSMALNLGACVGPVIGGAVAFISGSYVWLFWALAIVGVILMLSVAVFLPETARNLVGNGDASLERKWWEESWVGLLRRRLASSRVEQDPDHATPASAEPRSGPPRKGIWRQSRIVNPISCLRVMFHLDTCFALWMQGSFYVVDYTVVAAMPDIYKDMYGFNELQVGLTYIPRGAGIVAAGYCIGKLMDYNYKTVARKIGWNIDSVVGDDLRRFPIERARARGSYYLLMLSTTILVSYGWAVTKHAPLAILLILQFMQGSMGTCFYNTYNALLVDIFPESPSTAAAAASIVRCAMAAAGVAILQPLLTALGRGWYFTILGLWSGASGAFVVFIVETKCMSWRTRRLEKQRARDAAD
jgi:multidrug resistance protein